MSGGRGALGRVVKWFVVPVGLAALGVFVVGPYLSTADVPIVEGLKPRPPASSNNPAAVPPKEKSKFGEPEVDVSFQKRARTSRRRSGSRRRAPTASDTPRTADAPAAEGT